MKKFFTLAALVLSFSAFSQITFQKSIVFPVNVTGNEIGVMPNGDLIVGGLNNFQSIYLTRLQPDGQHLYSKNLTLADGISTEPVISVSPAGYIDILSYPDSGFSSSGEYVITRLDGNMNVQFSKKLLANNYLFYSIYAPPTLCYFPNGDIAVSISSYDAMVMLRLDPNGNLVWHREFTGDSLEPKNPSFAPSITPDGGAIIPGKRNSDNFFIKIDGNGNVQWASLLDAGFSFYAHAKKVIPAADGGYYAVGFMINPTTTAFIMKLDAGGNLQWMRNYTHANFPDLTFMNIVQTYTGHLALVGESSYLGTLVVIMDPFGNVLKTVEPVLGPNDYIYNPRLVMLNNSDLLLSATFTDGMNYSPIVFRSDWISMLWCQTDTISLEEIAVPYNPNQGSQYYEYSQYQITVTNTSASIGVFPGVSTSNYCATTGVASLDSSPLILYPNPATDVLNLDLGDQFEPGMSYQIVDGMGRVVMKGAPESSLHSISIREFAPGIYHLKMNTGQALSFSKE